jgi:cation transport ATPase
MEEKNITEQESLAIIQQMINKSKKQLTDRSKYFMMWGVAVFACAIIQYLLLKNLQTNTQRVWLAMPVLAIVQLFMSIRDRKKEKVVSHNTAAISSVWLALGISFFILAFLSFRISFEIFPFLILLYGIGTFVTGRIIQFTPLVWGGIVCFMLSILITYIDGAEKLLILALSVVVSYIIPGILLKREFKNQQN